MRKRQAVSNLWQTQEIYGKEGGCRHDRPALDHQGTDGRVKYNKTREEQDDLLELTLSLSLKAQAQ